MEGVAVSGVFTGAEDLEIMSDYLFAERLSLHIDHETPDHFERLIANIGTILTNNPGIRKFLLVALESNVSMKQLYVVTRLGIDIAGWLCEDNCVTLVRHLWECYDFTLVHRNNRPVAEAMLLAAAEYNALETLDFLLEQTIEIDCRDAQGRTPLCAAATKGHLAVVRSLLDMGANVNAEDNDGQTALQEAVRMGHKDVVRLLIDALKNEVTLGFESSESELESTFSE